VASATFSPFADAAAASPAAPAPASPAPRASPAAAATAAAAHAAATASPSSMAIFQQHVQSARAPLATFLSASLLPSLPPSAAEAAATSEGAAAAAAAAAAGQPLTPSASSGRWSPSNYYPAAPPRSPSPAPAPPQQPALPFSEPALSVTSPYHGSSALPPSPWTPLPDLHAYLQAETRGLCGALDALGAGSKACLVGVPLEGARAHVALSDGAGGSGSGGAGAGVAVPAIEAALLRVQGVGRALAAVEALAEELASGGSEEAAIAAISSAMESALPFPLPQWFTEAVELIQLCTVRVGGGARVCAPPSFSSLSSPHSLYHPLSPAPPRLHPHSLWHRFARGTATAAWTRAGALSFR
jgi:hypothetical protein